MKIFIPPAAPRDGSGYLAEILCAFGLCFAARCSRSDALKTADPKRDLILLPHGGEADGLEPFLQAGGSVVAIQPGEPLERLAKLTPNQEDTGPLRLRLAQPVCPAARGEPLWTLGPFRTYEPKPGPNVIGYLYKPNVPASETIGILDCAVGAGRLVVYAYDPAICIARLRQGSPERANFLPPGQKTPRATFLHEPNPPADTFWRPTADLHALTLCGVIQRLLERNAPMPTLWHIPEGRPAILLFSGDEDASKQEENDQQMRDLEARGGAMNLYVIPDNTSITRELIERYTKRGHAISVHPNLVPAAGQPSEAQLGQAEAQVRMFQDKFQWPVRTLRNHCYMWPGYLDLPALYERLGIGMDANTTATLYGSSPDGGPFVNVNAAMPLRFVRENGSLIHVYQQPTHVNDDLVAHPTKDHSHKYSPEEFDCIAQRICDEATRFFHAPICANVHPCNYVQFSGPHARALMARAVEFNMPIWSLERWHDFWRARASWRMSDCNWDGTRLRFVVGGSSCQSLCLAIPTDFGARRLSQIAFDGAPAHWEKCQRYGRAVAHAIVGSGGGEVAVSAEYGSPARPN